MFCKNCGKELLDKAAVCTNCGIWVKDDEPKKATEKAETVEKAAKLSKLFGILAVSFIALTMLLVFIGIAEIDMYNYGGYYYRLYVWEEEFFGPAWIISWSALGLAIVSFVFGIKTKKCLGVRYLSTVIFIMSIVAFFVPLFFGLA